MRHSHHTEGHGGRRERRHAQERHHREDGAPETVYGRSGRDRRGAGRDGPGRGRRHGRGRSGRVFGHGELRFVILAMIAEKPQHGYEIIKAIEERLAGTYSPSPGVVYPTLTMLEEMGHATVEESEGKRLFAITPDGAAFLAANQATLDEALARIDSVQQTHGDGPAPAIIRATENLKLALRLRQERGPLTEEEIRTVAAALDTAALAIEQS